MPLATRFAEYSTLVSGNSTISSSTESDSKSESDSGRDGRRSRQRRRPFISVEEALKPIHPSIKSDSNSWPCFALLDTNVYLKDGTTLVNLLEAETVGPFVVTGRLDLELEDEYYSYLKKSQYRDAYIKIRNVSGYSFGDRTNPFSREAGHAIIWAGSDAFGWFEVLPSLNYEPYVTRMTTAINAYCFLQTFYRKKRAASTPIEEVIARYAVQAEGSGHTRHEAEKVLLGHASFLISQMRRKEGVDFENTIFWNWLVASSPSIVLAMQKLNVAIMLPKLIPSVPFKSIPPPPVLNNETLSSSMGKDDSDDEDDDNEYVSIADDDSDTDLVDPPQTNADWIIWMMNTMVSSGDHQKERISAAKVWYKVFLVFSCDPPALAREVVRVNAAEVREKIDASWRGTNAFKELGEWDPLVWNDKDSPEWREKALHHPLKLRSSQPLVQGRPRERQRRNGSGADATNKHHNSRSLPASDSQFRSNHGTAISGRRTRGFSSQNISTIEPLTTKAAIKARVDAERENITSGEGVEPPSKKKGRRRVAGKIALLHPPGSKKRVLSAASEDEADDSRYKKRARSSLSSSRASSEDSHPTSSSSNDLDSNEDHASPTDLNDAGDTTAYESSPFPHETLDLDRDGEHHLVLSSTPIHTLHANTRNGGWKCDLPTSSADQAYCHFAIYDINAPTAQAAFTQHCYDHASGILTAAHLTSSSTSSNNVNASASHPYPSPSASLPRESGVSGEKMARLVATEAAKTGHKVSHLVEKLMALNKMERDEEEAEAEVIAGKKVPMRIKRPL